MSRFIKKPFIFVLLSFCILFGGCATIPSEAPDLSMELGKRISAIQGSNLTLLHRFFDLKRDEIDRFIQEEWVPTFAEEIFSQPNMKKVWGTIVSENNTKDRLRFLVTVGPKLQARINMKRIELIKPLDDIERRIDDEIQKEYAQARAINNTITSFLFSASKISENRDRYLEMIGITDEKIGNTIDKLDDVVTDLVSKSQKAEEKIDKAKDYLQKLQEIKDKFLTDKKEG